MFYIPAIAGGIFGLLGGYLIDRFGRRRVLIWSILLSCSSTLATGYSSSALQLLIYRCITFVGVSVEFVAATAWLAELFPERDQRETILGSTQIFASTGGILMSGASYLSLSIGPLLPAIHGGHEAWRYTILWGILPALPLLIVRPFLPESPIWQKKREEGTLQRPSILELFHPEFRKTALLELLHDGVRLCGFLRDVAAFCPHHSGDSRSAEYWPTLDQQKIVSAFAGSGRRLEACLGAS